MDGDSALDSVLDSGTAGGDSEIAGGDVDISISLRPEWADVCLADYLPAADDACHPPVVAIAYEDDDAETLACFRAVVARGETSARALQLTEEVRPSRTCMSSIMHAPGIIANTPHLVYLTISAGHLLAMYHIRNGVRVKLNEPAMSGRHKQRAKGS